MKRKRLAGILLTAMLAGCLTGCGSEGQQEQSVAETLAEETASAEGGTQKNESAYRVGSALSDAYVNPRDYEVPEDKLKATGYEYNRDALHYELVWSDEFDYEGKPDESKWSYETGASGWGNHELENYTAGDNVTVADGRMTIELRQEGDQYTSTRLVSRKKGDWTYCKVEASVKLPTGLGTWPAFWMMPTDSAYGAWPASGEIDIMEHVGYDQDVIVQTVHTAKNHGGQGKGKSFPTAGVSEEFHTYSIEWLPDKIIFGIDGEDSFIYDPHDYGRQPTSELWPFDKNFFLIFNLAYGGDWGGARGTDDACLPAEYVVDYVRVYQSSEILEMTGQKVGAE